MEEKICEVDIDEIRVSPFQPRRGFSNEELKELAQSILSVGLIHPPVVRTVESKGKLLYYELIAGERRWRAARQAGLKQINVLVRNSTDENAAKSTLIENIQRVNLNPIEMAEALKNLLHVFQMTQEEVADKVGKKRSTVANYLRLLALPTPIQLSLSRGEITMGHAKAILSLESDELQTKLSELIIQNQLTVRDTEKESRKLAENKSKKKETHLEALQEKIQQRLGTKVELASSKRGGRLIMHYYSLEDLERLLALLHLQSDAESSFFV